MSGKKLQVATWASLVLAIGGCATTNSLPHVKQAQADVNVAAPAATETADPFRVVGFLESDDSAQEDIVENVAAETVHPETVHANVPPRDLASLETRALATHPAINQQRARIQAARGSWLQSGLPFNPVAQYQSNEIGNDDSSGIHQLQINQTIVTANKLGLAQHVASAEIQKNQAELARVELQVLTGVRTAFIAALIAQQRVQQSETLVSIANQSVQSVRIMLEGQEASRIDLLQAQTAADQARLVLQNANANEQSKRRSLSASIGDGTIVQEPLIGNLNELLPETPWDSLMGELLAASPEIAKNHSELERAQRALRLACAQITPNVTAQYGVGFDAATDNTFGILGISVPLPIRNRNQGNIARARADVAAAHASVNRTQLELTNRLAEAVGRYQVAKQRVEMLEETIIPRAEETLALSRQAFQAGEISFLNLLTIQRTLSQTRLNVLDAVEQARNAAAEIDGMLVTLAK